MSAAGPDGAPLEGTTTSEAHQGCRALSTLVLLASHTSIKAMMDNHPIHKRTEQIHHQRKTIGGEIVVDGDDEEGTRKERAVTKRG